MAGRRTCLTIGSLLLAGAAAAADTCECADMADLRNREAESRAAIQAYRDALLRWAGSPPAIDEPTRENFQGTEIQPAINNVTTAGTNKAKGKTDNFCRTTVEPTSVCMTEVVMQHEHVHGKACDAPLPAGRSSRWSTLADYALEEISAYQAEAAYVHGALSNLTAKCQLQIEMTSDIWGGLETTHANAKGQVLATFTAPDHQPTTPYQGTGTLQYQTKDVGPPKKTGDKMLMKLAPVCYAASEGNGNTPFNVIDGYLWRSNVPPYEPRLNLVFEIHPTNETRKLKGQRGCPKSSEQRAFWSEWFLKAKYNPSGPDQVLIDDWTFPATPDIYAEKKIKSSCGVPVKLPGMLAPYGPLAPCDETTKFTVRLKR